MIVPNITIDTHQYDFFQSIQAVVLCKDPAQLAPQRHTIWRHIRLPCSHRVGVYYAASHVPSPWAPPADTIPGKGLLHHVKIIKPTWKDILVFCRSRHQRMSFTGYVEKALNVFIRIAGPEIHAPGT